MTAQPSPNINEQLLIEQIRDYGRVSLSMLSVNNPDLGNGVYTWSGQLFIDHADEVPELFGPDGELPFLLTADGSLQIITARGYLFDQELLAQPLEEILDALGGDEEEQYAQLLLEDEAGTEALQPYRYFGIISRIERNKELAGIEHVALGCTERLLQALGHSVVLACQPFPYLADEVTRLRATYKKLPDWLTDFWTNLGFTQVGDSEIWFRDPQYRATAALLSAAEQLNYRLPNKVWSPPGVTSTLQHPSKTLRRSRGVPRR